MAFGFTYSVYMYVYTYVRTERARDCFKKTWGPDD